MQPTNVPANHYPQYGAHPPHPSQLTRPRPADHRDPEPVWLVGFDETLHFAVEQVCTALGAPANLCSVALARILYDTSDRHGSGGQSFGVMLKERGLPTGRVHSPEQASRWAEFTAEMEGAP